MSLRATLLLALAYVLLLALIALGVPLGLSLRDRVDSEVRGQARSQADVVAASASELLGPGRRSGLKSLVEVSADSVRGRVIVVDRSGRLLADSAGAPAGRSYASRPEIRAALRGRSEQITRNSSTLGTELLATAVPVLEHGRPGGAVRITQSVAAVNRAVRTSLLDLAALAGAVLLLALAAGALIARRIALPIRRLDDAARRVAGGDLDTAVVVEGSSEQRSLGRAFNEMTQRIRRLLRVQQDFVADASHQLRTPLTGLRLRLENLAARPGGNSAEARELDAAMGEIDRLSQIVDELLILSRAGEHELPAEEIDLAEAARRAAERWRDAGRGARDRDRGADRRGRRRLVRPPRPRALARRPGRERAALLAGRHRGDDRRRAGAARGARRGTGPRAGRGGGGVRALQPRQRRPPRAERDRPRAADRPRAEPPVGRRGDAGEPQPGRPACCHGGARTMRSNSKATLSWIGLALLGIVIAGAVAVAASSLASRQIGLSSESISAGDTLAPAFATPKGSGRPHHAAKPAPTPSEATTTTTVPPPEPTVATPAEAPEPPVAPTAPSHEGGDSHGGGSGDGGGGHGADD